jgi:hypothetical protein
MVGASWQKWMARHLGFAELAIRNYSKGCDFASHPFSGRYLDRRTVATATTGAGLIAQIEAFVGARGFTRSDQILGSTIMHPRRHIAAGHFRTDFANTRQSSINDN